jgi:Chaperone of endosialidase
MSDTKDPTKVKSSLSEDARAKRRRFLKTAGRAAVTAPAVALLLSVDSKRAAADTFAISGLQDSTRLLSDRRLKQHLKRVGVLANGLPLYSFRYIWGGPTFVGVMAQDVLRVMPDAVATGPDGFYRVDYGMLGTRMMTSPEWRERHPIAA